MAHILFIEQSKSFITSALAVQLEKEGHSLTVVRNNPEVLQTMDKSFDMVLINVEDTIMGELVYIKEQVIEKNIPVFVIGDNDVLRKVTPVIPIEYIKKIFRMPITIKTVAEYISAYHEEEVVEEKKKILVVDDSGAMLRNVKGWLEDKYQVILANSGVTAIKCLTMNRPDLILLDYEMPVCDGRQVLEMIRSEVEFANIPVIFLTGKNDKETVDSVSGLKPEGYLLKTMEPRVIVQSIDNLFKREKIKNSLNQMKQQM
ncbi:MAG: response regulator [Lachnospiraceae bacterium]|nr:response regulator [Lachnospiraceae bacterium]